MALRLVRPPVSLIHRAPLRLGALPPRRRLASVNAPIMVFEAPSCRAVRILKVFSVGGAAAAVSSIPMVVALSAQSALPSVGLLTFTIGFTALSSVGITSLLGFLLKPYLTRIFVHRPGAAAAAAPDPATLPKLSFVTPLRIDPTAARRALADAAQPGNSAVLSDIFSLKSKVAATMTREEIESYRDRMEEDLAAFPVPLTPDTTLTFETLTMLGRPRRTTLQIRDLAPCTRFMKTWQVRDEARDRVAARQPPGTAPQDYFWIEWKSNVTRYAAIKEAVVWRIGQLIHRHREDHKQLIRHLG
ncbi:hypothetical protein IWQ60_011853 [Tieghemiomyces parasiticus]|uniref:Uncharacterized protein n=1 Tax=Tieghemiomyces parasiticus TaxID=78921 RepID=A0A9W8DI29_9FUNG|nr:hypothetical protein IWQ60_011853 [Tieghemiomyces parasiticus]